MSGIQPVLQQGQFLDLVGGTMRGGLVDDAGQRAKLLDAGGYSRVIQGICHLDCSFGWDSMGQTIGEARSFCQQVLCFTEYSNHAINALASIEVASAASCS